MYHNSIYFSGKGAEVDPGLIPFLKTGCDLDSFVQVTTGVFHIKALFAAFRYSILRISGASASKTDETAISELI